MTTRDEFLAVVQEAHGLGAHTLVDLALDAWDNALDGDELRKHFGLKPKPEPTPGLYLARPRLSGDDCQPTLVQVGGIAMLNADGEITEPLRVYSFGGTAEGLPLDRWTDYQPVTLVPTGPVNPELVQEAGL